MKVLFIISWFVVDSGLQLIVFNVGECIQIHSNLYLLPKIHKKNNPGRPIINSVGSLRETMSALINEILRKYSKLAKSYIKDK